MKEDILDSKNRVQWVYSSSDNKELEERYDQWAKEYDKDLEKDFEYKAPKIATEFFAKYNTQLYNTLTLNTVRREIKRCWIGLQRK